MCWRQSWQWAHGPLPQPTTIRLIYLARSVTWRGRRFELAGVLQEDVEVCERPQGHGYVEGEVDRENPFFPKGTVLRGHEFHYSRLRREPTPEETAISLRKGSGCGGGRDGIVVGNVLASWTHLHAEGAREWAPALVSKAYQIRRASVAAGARETETTKCGSF